MDQLDTFIKDIIEAKQLPGITDEAKAGLVEEMRERLLDMINRALIEALPEDRVDALSTLLDGEDVSDDTLRAFVTDSGIDVQAITAKTMLAFRSMYLQNAEQRSQE